MKIERGMTLLEMLVASAIMAIAVVGLLSGISGAARNAARLRDYDRAVQMAQLRMNELLLDERFPRDVEVEGRFDPQMSGGVESGWRARMTTARKPPVVMPGELALDRMSLEVWWMSSGARRSFVLEGYRRHVLKPEDIPPAGTQ